MYAACYIIYSRINTDKQRCPLSVTWLMSSHSITSCQISLQVIENKLNNVICSKLEPHTLAAFALQPYGQKTRVSNDAACYSLFILTQSVSHTCALGLFPTTDTHTHTLLFWFLTPTSTSAQGKGQEKESIRHVCVFLLSTCKYLTPIM